ncbi:protease prsW family protein [Dongia mobilis]|uniref:Protease prsW family protein n=1 Tax=Dongia mobilis TaxID=578943 RepID=A0A4R6WQP8_9PROT|nr:PrsW family glutamic-type intramembrane protease [Dongia mobilis]TDQ80613.1 protease prsW family protein [Dongia mobilis]
MTAAAIAIVLTLTGIWVLVVQVLLPARIKWRVVALALVLGALSPLPIFLALDLKGAIPFPENPGLGDALSASFVLAAVPEELVKGVAVLIAILLLRHFSVFHQELDQSTAFRLPILCGLGFAAVENVAYSVNANLAQMAAAQFGHPLVIPLARTLMASMLHASLGCLMGFFLTRFVSARGLNWSAALAAYAAAVIGHAAVNWGLIAVAFQLLRGGRDIDEVNVVTLLPHIMLAAILIPTVVICAIVTVFLARRRLRRLARGTAAIG